MGEKKRRDMTDSCLRCRKYIGNGLHKSGLCTKCRTEKCTKCSREFLWTKNPMNVCYDCKKKKRPKEESYLEVSALYGNGSRV